MTNADNVYDEGTTDSKPTAGQESQDQNTGSVFEQLVGEGKKYKTSEDLAKAKKEADAFIEQLKLEKKQVLEDSISKAEVDRRFDEFLARQEQQRKPESRDNTNPQLAADQIAEIVRNTISTEDAKRTAGQNIKVANDKIVEQYGDKAKEFVANRAKELGLSKSDLADISAKSPNAFFNIIGLDKKSTATVSVTTGSVNTESNFNRDTKPDTWDYYNELRRKNREVYYSPKIQNEIFQKVKAGLLPTQT